jgi:hypothetical protein
MPLSYVRKPVVWLAPLNGPTIDKRGGASFARAMLRASSACVIGLVSCSLGCSSAYIPQRGPRLSIVMDGGTLSYVRDGKTYEGGYLGGDIEEAVSGNATAEQYAHDYRSGMMTGFAVSMFGLAGMVGGLAVTTIGETRSPSDPAVPIAGIVMVLAGAVLDLVGSLVMVNAVPHLYDAVNAYNDGVPTTRAPEPAR